MRKLYFMAIMLAMLCLAAPTHARSKEFRGVGTYGSLVGPDGSDWFFTQNFTPSTEFEYAYGSTDITIYDNEMEQVMTIHYDVPAGVKTNTIEPYGQVTQKFFDYKESTYEVMVYVHSLGAYDATTSSYEQIHENYIFSGEYEGVATQIFKYDCQNLGILDASSGYDINQRLCAVTQEGDSLKAKVYTRGKWSSKGTSEPILEHTFTLPFENVNYTIGSWVNTYSIDGKFYYVISYYENPYSAGTTEDYDIIINEDNYFIAEVYDQDYALVQKVRVSADPNPGSPYTFHGVGRFGEDLTKGFYSGDDQLNLIICYDNYVISTDDSEYDFKVFDQKIAGKDEVSEPIKTIFEGIQTWNFLSDVPGHESQVAVLRSNGVVTDDEEGSEIAMIDLPSCKEVHVLPSLLNGHKVNWNFDRVPVSATEYNYVFALNEGEINEDTRELLGLIGWYTPEGQEVRVDSLSIGTKGQMFKPTLSSDFSVGRYVFNNDDLVEYPYMAKMTKKGSTAVENVVRIANQNGEVIKEYKNTVTGKSLSSASFLNYNSTNPWMVVVWVDDETQLSDITAETMPFTSLEGKGKEADPYLIKTAGDLAQIASKGNGYYKVVNDIDMALLGKSYIPATNFSGVIDGEGHIIKNLNVDVNNFNVGLIGTSVYGTNYAKNEIKNITLDRPVIKTGSLGSHAGFIVGWAQNTKVSNCFVTNGQLNGVLGGATIGGIVGQMGTQSAISKCGVFQTSIEAPYSPVGGIVGKAIYNSGVEVCAVKDAVIVGGSSVGGIMGEAEDGTSSVQDCHVQASIKGSYAVGGVVGSTQRSIVQRNFVELSELSAELDTRDNTYAAGGVAGYVLTSWEGGSQIVFTNNVVVPAKGSESIWDDISGKTAWHRILGFTAQDETYETGEKHKTEKGADKNYAAASISANGSKELTSPDGADAPALSLDFFKGLDFAYGTTNSAPWKDNNGRPALYFEEDVIADGIETVASAAGRNTATDGIYSLSGMRLGGNRAAKGIMIVVKNGKAVKVVK